MAGHTDLPGLYSFEVIMLSIIPPVLPILKQPGLMPPTWSREEYKAALLKLQATFFMSTEYVEPITPSLGFRRMI